jgi:hypothetical protein
MTLIIACLVVLAFIVVCHAMRIVTVTRQALGTARGGMAAMRDPALDDEAKERAAKRAAIGLFGGFFSITLRSLVAVLASAAAIYAADITGLAPAPGTIALLASWEFLSATALVLPAAYLMVGRLLEASSRGHGQ